MKICENRSKIFQMADPRPENRSIPYISAVHSPDLIASAPGGGGSRRDTVKADLRSVSVNDLYWRGRRDLISGSGGDLALVAVFPADVYLFDTLSDKTSVRPPEPDLSIRERRCHLDLSTLFHEIPRDCWVVQYKRAKRGVHFFNFSRPANFSIRPMHAVSDHSLHFELSFYSSRRVPIIVSLSIVS